MIINSTENSLFFRKFSSYSTRKPAAEAARAIYLGILLIWIFENGSRGRGQEGRGFEGVDSISINNKIKMENE